MELSLRRYTSADAEAWNEFVRRARNGVFLFERAYMDYHADRFTDHSLLLYKEDELMALLPASEAGGTVTSHGGLTFGGFLQSHRTTATFVLEALAAVKAHYAAAGCTTMVYKAIPHIFHRQPAAEDLYALFRADARLVRRDLSSVIDLSARPVYTKGTKSNLSKARRSGVTVEESRDFALFMEIEEALLRQRYNTRPTHTAEEILLLASRFPDRIRLFLAWCAGRCLGGTVTYDTGPVLHTQYIGITDEGKALGALDLIIDRLLSEGAEGRRFFSFGTSTEQGGRYLNEGLVRNKESFGARAVTHDFYQLDLHP